MSTTQNGDRRGLSGTSDGPWKLARKLESRNSTMFARNRQPASSETQPEESVKILRGSSNKSNSFRGLPASSTKLAETRSSTVESEDAAAVASRPTPTFAEPKAMPSAVRLIDDTDSMEFVDFCKEYLMDSNKGFTVIGAIGAQGTGKSTILSMLAGNDPSDMYRQYAFRPFYRESADSTRHQTTKIYVYINKWRTAFLDCQAIGSATLLSDFLRSHRRLTRDQATDQFELMSLQILTLMTKICHTLLLCVDWFVDMNIVGDLLRTEVFKEKIGDSAERKVNVVVLHQKAKPDAFEPLVVLERMRTLKAVFENSAFNVCGGVNLAAMGFQRYCWMDCDVNYIPMSEMPPLKFGRSTSSHHSEVETPRDGSIPYAKIIYALRTKLFTLPRPSFSNSPNLGTSELTELEWFTSSSKQWERILKELKVGFNDTLHTRDRYLRGRHQRAPSRGARLPPPDEIKRSEISADGNSEAEKDTNYYESAVGRRRDAEEVYASPPRRRRGRNRRQVRRNFAGDPIDATNLTSGASRRMRRQFFVDERDDTGEKAAVSTMDDFGVSPGRYRIKKRPEKGADSQSEEEDESDDKAGDDDGPGTGPASCCGEDDEARRRRASGDSRHELGGAATSTDEKGGVTEEEIALRDDNRKARGGSSGFDGRKRNRTSVARRNEAGRGGRNPRVRTYATDTSFREGVNIDRRHYEAVRQQIFASKPDENEQKSSGEVKLAQRIANRYSPELEANAQGGRQRKSENVAATTIMKRIEVTKSPSGSSNAAVDDENHDDDDDDDDDEEEEGENVVEDEVEEQVHDAYCSQESDLYLLPKRSASPE